MLNLQGLMNSAASAFFAVSLAWWTALKAVLTAGNITYLAYA